MLKDLIAIVDNAEAAAGFIGQALGFAAAHDAHLAVTLLTPDYTSLTALPPYAGYPLLHDQVTERQAHELEAIRRLTEGAPVPVEVRGISDATAYLFGASRIEGRYADLLLIGATASFEDDKLRARLIETAVMSSGGPVLVLPEGAQLARIGHAVVGWDASGEARRAVRDLMDVIEPGAHIDIVTVDAEESRTGHGQSPGSNIARYLARHGYEVEVHPQRTSDGQRVSGALESFARNRGADLLAIGAFAHSRVRDILLGGVTRELLAEVRLPLLLSR